MPDHGNTTDRFGRTAVAGMGVDYPSAELPTGTTLGRYRTIRLLGRGGTGVVYEAFDPILQRTVAMKVLREGFAARPQSVRRFLREAQTAARLNHSHVVAVYDADQEKGIAYLVMELMEGGSADDRLRQWGPFGWVEATQVLADACVGLAAVHSAGLIHRDIKPSNIMRTREGLVKLADFGLALTVEKPSDSSNRHGQVVGTPLYMSPEQCRGEKLDARSDIYSLGATYYTLLTGLPPFVGKSSMEIMYGHCSRPIPDPCMTDSTLPAACADLIRCTMAKDPTHRPADANALLREFQAILSLSHPPETQALEWVPGMDKIAPTPIPGVVSTAVEPIAPIYITTRKPRTRAWFVGFCIVMMTVAYLVGRQYSAHPIVTEAAGQRTSIADSVSADGQEPKHSESGDIILNASGPVTTMAFNSDDSTEIFVGTESGEQKVFLWPFGKQKPTISEAGRPIVEAVYWNRSWLSVFDGKLHLFDSADPQQVRPQEAVTGVAGRQVSVVALHPSEKVFALAVTDDRGHGGGILLRTLLNRGAIDDYLEAENRQPPVCLAFSTDGSYLLSGQQNGIVKIWKVEKPQQSNVETRFVLRGRGNIPVGLGSVACIAALDSSHFAVAVGTQVWICDAVAGTAVRDSADTRKPLHDGPNVVDALAVTANGKHIACTSGNVVKLYDAESQALIEEMTGFPARLTALAFDNDGKSLAIGDVAGKICIRHLK